MANDNDGDGLGCRPGPGYGRRLVDDKSVVFVGGINWKASEADLLEFFNDAVGPAVHCRIIVDRDTNRSKGYGFVTFASPDLARDAKETDPPLIFMGKTLNCQSAYRRASIVSQSWPPPASPTSSSPYSYYPAMFVDSMGVVYVAHGDVFSLYPQPSWIPSPSYINPSLMPPDSYYRYPASVHRRQDEQRLLNCDKARCPRITNIAEGMSSSPRKEPMQSSHHRGERTQQPPSDLSEGDNDN